jgi:hypothetical protein
VGIYIGLIAITEPAVAEGLPKITQEDVMRIQRYFNVGQEKKILLETKQKKLEVLAEGMAQEKREQFSEEYNKLQKTFEEQETKLFAKQGMTEEEYNKIQADISANPGMLLGYVAAGGKIPEKDSKEKVEPPLTPEERLKKEGIFLDTLDAAMIEKGLNNPKYRLDVIHILGKRQDPIAIPYLMQQLKNESLLVQFASAGALCRHKKFDGVPLLLKALTDPSQHLIFRMSAIDSAGLCQEQPEVINAMLKLLEAEPNGSLRMHIALQIEQYGNESLQDALIKVRESETDAMVRHLLNTTIQKWDREKRIRELRGIK